MKTTLGKTNVTAVVAAYNEERTIGNVLAVLRKCTNIKQIIVVDDGSTDATASIAKLSGAQVISHRSNQGKAEAIKSSIKYITYDTILLCDADLIHLTTRICEEIIRPIVENEAAMSVGLHNYGPIANHIACFIPAISGDRALSKTLLKESIASKYFSGYGMELALHYYCTFHALPIVQRAFTHNQTPTLKKRGFLRGWSPVVGQAALLVRIFIAMHLKGWH